MSARREKRMRKLEASVAYLESRVYSVEKRQLEQSESAEVMASLDAEYEVTPRRGLLNWLVDMFGGGGRGKDCDL